MALYKYVLLLFFDPGTQFPGNKKYAMQYRKVQKSSWNELPPPSQNSHVVRWHCTAESEQRVAEIKS